jgi:hypothetical protein
MKPDWRMSKDRCGLGGRSSRCGESGGMSVCCECYSTSAAVFVLLLRLVHFTER